jgi:ArsR family transcriptional regulator
MRSVLAITKALSDRNRLRVLMALRNRELCVCQITELLGLASSTVSKHLSILWQAGLIDGRKDGRWMHYRLVDRRGCRPAVDAINWAVRNLAQDAEIRRDAERLKAILKMNPEELCKKQSKK